MCEKQELNAKLLRLEKLMADAAEAKKKRSCSAARGSLATQGCSKAYVVARHYEKSLEVVFELG
jgi:hypothetical protein